MAIDREEICHEYVDPSGRVHETRAWVTVPADRRREELQILVHGATYDHRYWDWPLRPEQYSYVAWATARGEATLNIDRLGSGRSSRPPGRELTLAVQAAALSELVAAVRAGYIGDIEFARVVLVSHSVGSILSSMEASAFKDVDAVVLTGTTGIDSGIRDDDPRAAEYYIPALADPALAHLHPLIDDGYLSPRPEARRPMFYYDPNVDTDVLELDEQLKGTMSLGETAGIGSGADTAADITVPTLVVVGQYDVLAMRPEIERDAYDAVRRCQSVAPAHFEFAVVPDAGHNLNLHRNAQETYEIIGTWLDMHAGI